MKKFLFIFAIALTAYACGSTDKPKETATTTTEPKNDLADNPDYFTGMQLVMGSNCGTCHKTGTQLVGPSYNEIAAKYAGATEKQIDTLAHIILKGVEAGKGHWGQQQMTGHPELPLDSAKAMVKYILLLKQP
jgi:cytochrome c